MHNHVQVPLLHIRHFLCHSLPLCVAVHDIFLPVQYAVIYQSDGIDRKLPVFVFARSEVVRCWPGSGNRLKKRPSAAAHGVEQPDLSLVFVDLKQLPSEPQLVPVVLSGHLTSILEHSSHRQDCILILNKSDLISAEHKCSMQAALEEAAHVPPACLLSCHTKDGLQDLLMALQNRLKTL